MDVRRLSPSGSVLSSSPTQLTRRLGTVPYRKLYNTVVAADIDHFGPTQTDNYSLITLNIGSF